MLAGYLFTPQVLFLSRNIKGYPRYQLNEFSHLPGWGGWSNIILLQLMRANYREKSWYNLSLPLSDYAADKCPGWNPGSIKHNAKDLYRLFRSGFHLIFLDDQSALSTKLWCYYFLTSKLYRKLSSLWMCNDYFFKLMHMHHSPELWINNKISTTQIRMVMPHWRAHGWESRKPSCIRQWQAWKQWCI